MGSSAIQPSQALGQLLRFHRKTSGWTLREVSDRCAERGERIPISTLARIETGKLDPGVRRMHLLLRLYRVPPHLVDDLLELEEHAADPPFGLSVERLYREGLEHWKEGRIAEGLAYMMALRLAVPDDEASRIERQRATLAFCVAARNLGKHRLSKQILDDLLCEPLDPSLLVRGLVLAASLWRALGSAEAAQAMIRQASVHVEGKSDQDTAFVHHQAAKLSVESGDAEAARAALVRAREIYERLGDRYDGVRASLLEISIAELEGAPSAAEARAREALDDAQRNGYRSLAVAARLEVGRLLVARGATDEGLDHLQRALDDAREQEDRSAEFFVQHGLWKAYLAAGRPEAARAALAQAKRRLPSLDDLSPEADEVRESSWEAAS